MPLRRRWVRLDTAVECCSLSLSPCIRSCNRNFRITSLASISIDSSIAITALRFCISLTTSSSLFFLFFLFIFIRPAFGTCSTLSFLQVIVYYPICYVLARWEERDGCRVYVVLNQFRGKLYLLQHVYLYSSRGYRPVPDCGPWVLGTQGRINGV